MNDLIVNLYDLPTFKNETNYVIKKPLSPNIHLVQKFIRDYFPESWVSEATVGLNKENPTCYIAVDGKDIIGFACYDATAKGYFGPTGVKPDYRNKGIGKALLMKTLEGLKDSGYGYAIIGAVGKSVHPFYIKTCKAVVIENSHPKDTIYKRLLK